MLAQLTVKNFALIRNLSIDFHPELTVFTGQTGAGKSILIDALQLALGSRLEQKYFAEKDLDITVQAAFEINQDALRQHACIKDFLDGESLLILKRIISPSGKNRCSVNGQMVNVSTLKDIGAILIDIHGQSDHQLIFNPQYHLEMIDRYGAALSKGRGLLKVKQDYMDLYRQYKTVQNEISKLEAQQSNKEREMDLLKYQIEEIEALSPKLDEETELEEERTRLAHSEKLYEITYQILEIFDGSSQSVSLLIGEAFRNMQQWRRIDESVSALSSQLDDIQLNTEEWIREVRAYQESLTFDSDRLKEVEDRLEGITKIKKKYGPRIDDALIFLKNAKEKYDALENYDLYSSDLKKKLAGLTPQIKAQAAKISEIRRHAIQNITKTVEHELGELGIKNATFSCEVEIIDFTDSGNEKAEFFFQPNVGKEAKPLAEIASGGEASRVMLAIKKALAHADETPTLIFDEIDANIGGRLGRIVGKKLKSIASNKQVLLITHLPQIASFGDLHLKVTKDVVAGKTCVDYKVLTAETRVEELSQMMSGEKKTKLSREHAMEMLESAALELAE